MKLSFKISLALLLASALTGGSRLIASRSFAQGQNLNVGNSSVNVTGHYLTVAGMIFPTSASSLNTILEKWDTNWIKDQYWLLAGSGSVAFYAGTGGGAGYGVNPSNYYAEAVCSSSLNLNQWYSVVGVQNNTTVSIYLNGNLCGSVATSLSIGSNGQSACIGDVGYGGGACTDSYTYTVGKLANVAIWNVALTPNQIQSLAPPACTPPPTVQSAGLKGYWPLGLSSPDPDYSGNRSNGTVTGATIATPPPCGNPWNIS